MKKTPEKTNENPPIHSYKREKPEKQDQPSSSIAILFLLAGAVFSMLSQILFSKGLSLDGVHILYRMIKAESFYFIETSRIAIHFFQQLPAWLFIRFSASNSLSALVWIFSLGLVWIHLISFIGSYFILPQNKKFFLFFPLFAFFTGPVTAFGVSISASLSASSYIWFVFFTVYYSNLSAKSHQYLFLLTPLPLLFSHEMMSYMAWPLILLCLLKIKAQKKKWIISIAMAIFFIASMLSLFFIFFPEKSEIENRSEFLNSLFRLEFFFKITNGHLEWIYPSCIIALFLLFSPFKQFIAKKYHRLYLKIIFSVLILFGITAFILPFHQLFKVFQLTNEEEARVWTPVAALPLSLLIWWLFEKRKLKWEKPFLLSCIIAVVSLTGWRIGSDYQFYQFQKRFSKQLSFCRGFVEGEEAFKNREEKFQHLFKVFNWSWKYMSSSLIYPRRTNIQAIVKSKKSFRGCYKIPSYGMCENNIDVSESRFFNFERAIYYETNNLSGCFVGK